MAVDGAEQAGDALGAQSAVQALVSVTTVPAGVVAIADGNHAVNVHQSAEDMGTYIACGDIGGTMIGTGDLAFGISEQNSSGYSGVGWIHDRGDGSSTVYVFLVESGAAPGASPASSPAGESPTATSGGESPAASPGAS
jgi:hypothetical protein